MKALVKSMESQIEAIKAFIEADDDETAAVTVSAALPQTGTQKNTAKKQKKTDQKSQPALPKKEKMKAVNPDDLKNLLFGAEEDVPESSDAENTDVAGEQPALTISASEKKETQSEKPKTIPNKPVECKTYSINIDSNQITANEVDDEEHLGRSILHDMHLDDKGCSVLRLQKCYHDNGMERLFIDRWHVRLTMLDEDMKVIGEKIVQWKSLHNYHYQLRGLGLERHKVSDDPHQNWMPNIINLDLG